MCEICSMFKKTRVTQSTSLEPAKHAYSFAPKIYFMIIEIQDNPLDVLYFNMSTLLSLIEQVTKGPFRPPFDQSNFIGTHYLYEVLQHHLLECRTQPYEKHRNFSFVANSMLRLYDPQFYVSDMVPGYGANQCLIIGTVKKLLTTLGLKQHQQLRLLECGSWLPCMVCQCSQKGQIGINIRRQKTNVRIWEQCFPTSRIGRQHCR